MKQCTANRIYFRALFQPKLFCHFCPMITGFSLSLLLLSEHTRSCCLSWTLSRHFIVAPPVRAGYKSKGHWMICDQDLGCSEQQELLGTDLPTGTHSALKESGGLLPFHYKMSGLGGKTNSNHLILCFSAAFSLLL